MNKVKRNKQIAKLVDELLMAHFDGERASFVIVFAEPPDYDEASYTSNVTRQNGLSLIEKAIGQLRGQLN